MAKKKGLMSAKDWDAMMAKHAKQQTAVEIAAVGGGNRIGKRNGKFHFRGNVIGKEMSCVVLGFAFENSYYGDEKYDPDNPRPPLCGALAIAEEDMVPHETSSDPQADACDGCWANEWESAETGRGKACKNGRRLVVMEWDEEKEVEECDIALINLSPTEIKYWKKYVNKLDSSYGRPTFGVVTTMSFVDDGGSQPVVDFEMESLLEIAEGTQVMERLEEAKTELMQMNLERRNEEEEEEEKPTRGRKKTAEKKVSKKKASKKNGSRLG